MKNPLSNVRTIFLLFLLLGGANPGALAQPPASLNPRSSIDEKLIEAVFDENWQTVKKLLLRGANPNVVEPNGLRPLHHAVYHLQPEIVNLLLQKGAEVNAADSTGQTALHFGITAGKARDKPRLNIVIKALLKAGANPNAADEDGETVLTAAVADSETGVSIIKTLLEGGADPNTPNRFGETAVQVMNDRKRADAVFQLLLPLTKNQYVKPSQKPTDQDVFSMAVANNLPRLTRMIAAGANANAVDASESGVGESAIYWAAYQCNPGMLNLLLKNGADVNKASQLGGTPLHAAVGICNDENQKEVIKVLLAAKANVNLQQNEGRTVLMFEAGSDEGDIEIVKMLLAAGADPNLADQEEQTAYDLAFEKERTQITAILQPLMKSFLEKRAKALAEARAKLPGKFYIAADGAEIYYEVRGAKTGTPLFVLHGGPGFDSKYLLASNAFDEIGKSRPIIIYDQRGGGRSAKLTVSQKPDVEKSISDLAELVNHLGFQKIALAGHSWGGFLAMGFTAVHPEIVSRLILIDSATLNYNDFDDYIDLEAKYPKEYEIYRSKSIEAAFNKDKAALRESVVAYMKMLFFSPENRDRFIAGSEGYTANQLTNAALNLSASAYDFEPGIRKLKIPTLIIHGRHDANIRLEVATVVLKNLIPQSKVVIFDRSGHLPFYEEPKKFAPLVTDFLSK